MPALGLIMAYARGRVIGRAGTLPWREPEDMRHFKSVTMGHALLMRRVCHASIGRALPGRKNFVISRNPAYAAAGCVVLPSFEAALSAAREEDACPFVIGGAQIYALALPLATRLEITEIERDIGQQPEDVLFPALPETCWREVHSEVRPGSSTDGRLRFRTLVRRGAPAP